MGGNPKIRDTFLGVPIKEVMAPLIQGNRNIFCAIIGIALQEWSCSCHVAAMATAQQYRESRCGKHKLLGHFLEPFQENMFCCKAPSSYTILLDPANDMS